MKVDGTYHDAFRMSLMTELAHTRLPLEPGAGAGPHFFNHESPK